MAGTGEPPLSPFDPPGWPGTEARWTSSAKSAVGTALTAASRVWFTISHGILNEVYYPRVDSACTRDFGLIVTGPDGYFSEEKRATTHEIAMLAPGVPAFRVVNTARDGRYRIVKHILSDPARDTVVQEITFEALAGSRDDYRLYALLAPHIVNAGAGNTGWAGSYKGHPMLFAAGSGHVRLALAASVPWLARSVGFVGASDGWQDLHRHGFLAERFLKAENGNIALVGEIDLDAAAGAFTLALAFATGEADEAAQRALASLQAGVPALTQRYCAVWQGYQSRLMPLDRVDGVGGVDPYRISTAVLAVHQPVSFPGAAIASLSVPWGYSKGDEDLGGYHLVWPRDLVETAGGFLAAGAREHARDILSYLRSVQEADGHWSQNMWLDGRPYWNGVQMDECAFPVLLADLLGRNGVLSAQERTDFLPMVLKAAGFLVVNGPVTGQDRWEEDAGYSPFTLAVEIAALLAAADMADEAGLGDAARYLRETADTWNDEIERWTFATGTPLCGELGIDGYYVRIAPPDTADCASPLEGFVPIKNRPPGESDAPATRLVSPDALALVRFGLRAADDPRIVSTVRAIDATVRVELPQGPLWRRYNGDGYGEHDDGHAFNGTGTGRPWPLLAAERAHYEIAAGRPDAARALLATLEASASDGGMLPEQVWDGPDLPDRELFRGRPSGSAMPLVWAHAEHIKLLRSLADGTVFDMPPQTVRRYQHNRIVSPVRPWRFNHKRRFLSAGKLMRLELPRAATVRWTMDGWASVRDDETSDTGFGLHIADLPTAEAAIGTEIAFTLRWHDDGEWLGENFTVTVAGL